MAVVARRCWPALWLLPLALRAQTWNDPGTVALIARAAAQRSGAGDSGLADFTARAHGFVFFLGQWGEGLADPPTLIKADQLALEVYWKAPGRSKQRIVGWRDRADLPAEIQYHRDHLGIVLDGFGERIRLGDGEEVRDVPHPLSPAGLVWYDFALADSLRLELPQRAVRVYEVLVRPKHPETPAVVGTLYLDADRAALVRMRVQFTRSAYRDPSLEDITVALDNGLWEGRYWLPREQEIEIRRRTSWLELPARGVIRIRWEIGDYRFNQSLPDGLFAGGAISADPPEARQRYCWPEPLDRAIARATGQAVLDLETVRAAAGRLAQRSVLAGMPAARMGAGSVSQLLHANRVEGLALGLGAVARPAGARFEFRAWASYGLSDRRGKARLSAAAVGATTRWSLELARQVEDVGDEPLIAPLLNSFAAQEFGRDYGDYVLLDRALVGLERRLGTVRLRADAGLERSRSVETTATAVWGAFRPNPPLGAGQYRLVHLSLVHRAGKVPPDPGSGGTLLAEAGAGAGSRYVRLRAVGTAVAAWGSSRVALSGWAGWASPEVRPDRALLWGGRGAEGCPGSGRCGGRYGGGGSLEVRFRLEVPQLAVSPLVSTGSLVLAPFVRGAWLDGMVAGAPWEPTGGLRPVAGVAAEWLQRLVRLELQRDVRLGRWALVVDLSRSLWPIL